MAKKGVPLTEEHKEKIGISNTGKHLSDETKERISKAKKGHISSMKGKHFSKAVRANMSIAHIGKKCKPHSEESKNKMSNSMIKIWDERTPQEIEEFRIRYSILNKGNKNALGHFVTDELKDELRQISQILWLNPDYRDVHSKKMIKIWQDPNYKEKILKLQMLGRQIKPNKPETTLLNLLQIILPNTYKYVGNGQVVLNGKCPDFIDFENKKIIELYRDYWHRGQDGKDRIEHFQKLGFSCLIIWEKELKNLHLVQEKIMVYHKLPEIGDKKDVS